MNTITKISLIIFLIIFAFVLLAINLVPMNGTLSAALINCGGKGQAPCTLNDLIGTNGIVQKIVDIILKQIVPALATIFLIIGGLMLLTSGGSPERVNLGKKIVFSAIIGLVLSLGAWAIIKFILTALGAKSKYIPS